MPKKKRTASQTKWEQEKLLQDLEKLKEKRQGEGEHKVTGLEMQQQLMDETRLQRAKAEQPKFVRTDARFKEIREELARRNRRKQDENIVEEFYVDSDRMVAVQLSETFTDLKNIIQKSGMKFALSEMTGEAPEITFAKTSHYFMTKYDYKNALFYATLAMDINPESKKVRETSAKIHSLLGNWTMARDSAEWILREDKTNVQAILIKAEALFNCCKFEHSLLHFHHGQRLAPDDDNFRLGIQKCHKTIKDSVRDGRVFKKDGVDLLFKILRKTAEIKSSDVAKYRYEGREKSNPLGFTKILNILKKEGELRDAEDDEVFRVTEKAEEQKKTFKKLKGALQKGDTGAIKDDDIIERAVDLGLEEKLEAQQKEIERQVKAQKAKIFAHQRSQARETRVFAKKALKAARTNAKDRTLIQKKQMVTDRLFEDKVYLAVLARGLNLKHPGQGTTQGNLVESRIAAEAQSALAYLKSREDFWDQIELGNDRSQPARVCESFRFLM